MTNPLFKRYVTKIVGTPLSDPHEYIGVTKATNDMASSRVYLFLHLVTFPHHRKAPSISDCSYKCKSVSLRLYRADRGAHDSRRYDGNRHTRTNHHWKRSSHGSSRSRPKESPGF